MLSKLAYILLGIERTKRNPVSMNNSDSIIPDYHECPDKAAEYLRMVLPLLSKCKMPANPINYSVCYEYVSGKNAPLQEVLDDQINDEQPLTPEITQQLYKQFVLNGASDKFDAIGKGLNDLVHQTLSNIEITENTANNSAANFTDQSVKLSGADNIADVKDIVQGIIAETKQLVDASGGLKSRLNETNKEVEILRQELEQMKETAKTDALTGLLNRRAFDMEMDSLIENAQASVDTTFLLLLDIDHFKRINDNYGHLVGDKVLRYTSKLLQQFVKDGGMAARYGGEEMAILLHQVDQVQATKTANEIREALAKSRLQRKDSGESIGQVTISIGVSALRVGDTVESLIERADKALYQAKESGRNQVIVADVALNA